MLDDNNMKQQRCSPYAWPAEVCSSLCTCAKQMLNRLVQTSTACTCLSCDVHTPLGQWKQWWLAHPSADITCSGPFCAQQQHTVHGIAQAKHTHSRTEARRLLTVCTRAADSTLKPWPMPPVLCVLGIHCSMPAAVGSALAEYMACDCSGGSEDPNSWAICRGTCKEQCVTCTCCRC